MSREEFMRQLEELLADVSEEEKQEALSYYRSYFEDAGIENEERILKELESPQKVAATIKADLGMEDNSKTGEYTEHGFEDCRFDDSQKAELQEKEPEQQKESRSTYDGNQTLKIILIIAIAIVTSPVWLGLAGGILGGIGGILGGIFGLAVALVCIAGSFYICGGVLFGIGIGQMATGSLAAGFALTGAGLLVLAAAVLATVFCVWICGKLVPWICNVIGRLWRRIFSRKERAV